MEREGEGEGEGIEGRVGRCNEKQKRMKGGYREKKGGEGGGEEGRGR